MAAEELLHEPDLEAVRGVRLHDLHAPLSHGLFLLCLVVPISWSLQGKHIALLCNVKYWKNKHFTLPFSRNALIYVIVKL